ncbi:photoreceptor cilium actin regulator [Melanotaenia boesemani]|uniref:photoreceptor cilium actin regulator n=1 Tax=Melanotaenia boesemani TaxID=1250792 RepID=UPI001C04AF1B|nr:photoreceptor cilium actin regulator [Melanotaenia boesemani]
MGCSPSRGNFAALGIMRKGRMLPPVPPQNPGPSQFEDRDSHNSPGSTNMDIKEKKAAAHSQVFQKETQMTPQKKRNVTEQVNMEAVSIDKMETQVMDNSTASQKKEKNTEKQDIADKKPRKPKKNAKAAKVPKKKVKDKDKDKDVADQKVDFPEPLVKAHQAAYAFLNPSINKYDILLGLLEETTQTQVYVQPMVAFIALRYEEIIQGLEEMADEGEKVLQENGENLAWPSQMKNLSSSTPLKPGSANADPPPDLLQQLLQYTTQRMRSVSRTVGGIGDSALEEAVEYFASVSELLEEKLKVKRSIEARLMQLITRIEMASLRKPGPEDSALFSEDSGIGAENESLAGSEKQHRRESCGSTGTNRTIASPMGYTSMNISGLSKQNQRSQISPSVSLTSLNSLGSICTIMPNDQKDSLLGSFSLDDGEDDDDEEEVNKGVGDVQVAFRMQSNSEKNPHRLPPKRIENPRNVEMTLKMKNAISGRIQFVPKQNSSAKAKVAGSPQTSRREWTEEEIRSPKRPQTAAPVRRAVVKKTPTRGQRSRSAESLRSKGEDPTLLELERTQKDLNQRLQKLSKSKVGGNSKTAPLNNANTIKLTQRNSPAQSPATTRKNSLLDKDSNPKSHKDKISLKCTNKKEEQTNEVEEDKQKGEQPSKFPIKATPPPSPPLSPRPSPGFHRGRNSVRKLIDTFSQGIEETEDPKVLGPLKGVRRCGVPVLPGLGNVEAVLSSGITSCRPEPAISEKTDYLDLDNLPPPPLEVLMDKSFESAQSGSNTTGDGVTKVGKSPVLKRAGVSQRLKASVQSVTVLPSKGGLPLSAKVISPAKVDKQETTVLSKVSQPDVQPRIDQGVESDSLYQQARNIIHLKQSSESNSGKSSTNCLLTSNSQHELENQQQSGNLSVPGPNSTTSIVPSPVATTQPPATPPVSRGRMLPSTPSTPSTLHGRLPSPHCLKKQPSPPLTASPPVHRALPAPPAVHRRLPSPPVGKQNVLNSNTAPSYPFKAPSPPASPKVQRLSRENSSEDSSSARMFSNARSVFCPVSPSMFEAKPCAVPKPPQAWTSTRVSFISSTWGNRGRFPVSVQGPRPFVRRSQSDRRPSLSLPPRSQGISVAETCGSEPAICCQGLDDEPIRDGDLWGSQSELRATPRSASHPDLCIVGQALHRD